MYSSGTTGAHAGAIVFDGAMLDLMPWMYLGGTYVLHEAFNAERYGSPVPVRYPGSSGRTARSAPLGR